MRRSVVRLSAVACLFGVLLAGAAWSGRGATGAQEATPASHGGQHGQHTPASPAATAQSPYAADFDPDATIRSLTPEEVAQIERGEGAGFALPAEINGVPGPRHVLDLAGDLGLSAAQVAAVQAVADEMRAAAIPAGRRYLDAVLALEADLRAGTLTQAELPGRVVDVAQLEGGLAAAHLIAHLETAALLTPEQIAAYDRLRGYR